MMTEKPPEPGFKIKDSLIAHTLISMGIRITLVILAVSCISYWHIIQTLEEQTYDKLKNYIQERGKKESAIFELAENNHQVFKQQYLQALQHGDDVTVAEFDAIYEQWPDGTTRMRKARFNGVIDSNGMISRYTSSYLGSNAPIDDQAFRNRLIRAYQLIDRFGPAWINHFANIYVSMPENGVINYWPGVDWGANAISTLDVNDEEWVYVANKTNNPERASVWTGLYYDQTADEWMVSCITPVDQQDRQLLSIGHDYLLNKLFERVFNDHLEGTYNLIFREDGRLIAHPDKVAELQKNAGIVKIQDLNDQILGGIYQQVLQQTRDIDGNVKVFLSEDGDSFLAASRITGPGWWFITVFPKELLSSTARSTAEFILLLGCLSLIVELLMLFLVLRFNVVEPLKMFVGASTAVKEGQFDKVVTDKFLLTKNRSDEMGTLTRMFHAMVGKIEENITQLQQLDILKDEFMANTSHELKTPLNGIVGIASSMLDGAVGPLTEKQRYNLSLIVISGQRLTNLVND
ncbi:MAG: hypothetical protein ACI8WB_005217, partial [Phenylobacterium sp.]